MLPNRPLLIHSPPLRLKGFRDTFWNTPEGGRVRNDLPFCTRSLDFARDDRGERRDDRGAVFGTTCRSVQDPSTWSLVTLAPSVGMTEVETLYSFGRDDIKENAALPMGRLLRALPCHFDREGLKARRVEKSCAQAYLFTNVFTA